MQAPGRADEDRRGDFPHGGWAQGYGDDVMAAEMGKGMAASGAMLFGRRTYDDFAAVWPKRTDNPFTPFLTAVDKFVVTHDPGFTSTWENTHPLVGEASQTVAELVKTDGPDLSILGSGALVRELAHHGLIDEYVLLVHPLVLGTGIRLFGYAFAKLELISSVTTTTGVVIARYRPATAGEGAA